MSRRYSVESVVDDEQVLEVLLNQIATRGGKVVQVIWQPAPMQRSAESEGVSADVMLQDGGFVVISEHPGLAIV